MSTQLIKMLWEAPKQGKILDNADSFSVSNKHVSSLVPKKATDEKSTYIDACIMQAAKSIMTGNVNISSCAQIYQAQPFTQLTTLDDMHGDQKKFTASFYCNKNAHPPTLPMRVWYAARCS